MLEHRIDLGFVEGITRLPNLRYTTFLADELVAVVSVKSRLQLPEEIEADRLPAIPLVVREHGSGTLDVIERALASKGITGCMGIVSIRSIARELAAGDFRIIEIKDVSMHREFCFAELQGQDEGLAQAFMQFARHHSREV